MDQERDVDFRAVAMQAPVAWSVIDLAGGQVIGNAVYAALFGYEPTEMSELNVEDLTHPDDRSLTSAYLEELVAGSIDRHEVDKRYVRKDGSVFVGRLVASVLRGDAGRPTALVGVITDVTEARATADALSRSEDKLAKMLTNISDTVTLVGPDGTIHATTGSRREILGYPHSFWQGRQLHDVAHPDDADRVAAMTEQVLADPGTEVVGEFRVRHHDGHYEDVEIAAVNMLADPAVGAVVVTSRNITQRKADEREMVEMRDAAIALAEQRASFVANVSHELRTPLHAVLGLAELLGGSGLRQDQLAHVRGIQGEARRLQATVDDLLDYAKVEAHGIVLDVGPTNVRWLVQNVVDRSSVAEFAAGLSVGCAVHDDVPDLLLLDAHRFDQVLTNLVSNAVKFTAAGSVVIEVSREDSSLIVAVIDTGPGVPESHRDAVFEPFTQVPGTAGPGGTGLGLALVKGLVDLMNGSVAVQANPAGGSIFRLSVPLVHPTTSDVAQPRPQVGPARSARSARVLVVEDNEINQLLAREQLTRLGHRYEIVATGTAGVAALSAPDHGFDIVLMDWQLPDLDGLEATRQIRLHEAGDGRVPIVGVTASAMPEDRTACRDAGMDDFLPKPVGLADLAATIDRWLPEESTIATGPEAIGSEATFAVNEKILDSLVEDLDSRVIVESLVDRYLQELRIRSGVIQSAVIAGDLEALHRVGHTLRSTSEMFGAVALSAVCRNLEAVASTAGLDGLLLDFTAVSERTDRFLRQWHDRAELRT